MNRSELDKLSKSQLIELMLSKNEIPKPSIISNVVKWGKKQVENWGDWLMKGVKWGKKQVDNLGENLGEWFMNLEAPKADETEADETEAYETAAEETETDETEAYETAAEEIEADETEAVEINLLDQALKGYTKSYEISIKNNKDPLLQLQNTRIALESHISSLLTSMNGLKFLEALKVTLSKISDGETIHKTPVFFSTPQTIMNNTEIKASLEASQQIILNKIAIWISEGSGWTIESVDNHYLNVVTFQPLTGSSYIKMPRVLRNRSLINMKNTDNECFRWCHIRHLNPQKTNPQRIKQVDKEYIKNLNYSGIEFPVTIKQYNKIEKQNNININVVSFHNNMIFPIYSSKERNKDELNLLLLTKTEGEHYILIQDFNKFMHNITKHNGKKTLLYVLSSTL